MGTVTIQNWQSISEIIHCIGPIPVNVYDGHVQKSPDIRQLYTWLELPVTLKQGKNINKTMSKFYSANEVKVKRLSKF